MREFEFPEASPNLVFSQRGDEVLVATATDDVMPLNQLQYQLVKAMDGKTEVGAIAEKLSKEFGEELSAQDVLDFVKAARKLGLLSLRYAGPPDEELAARRCSKALRAAKAKVPPEVGADPLVSDLTRRVFDRLKAKDPRGALAAGYALQDVAPSVEWVRALSCELERLGEPPAIGEFNPTTIIIPLLNPTRLLGWLDRRLGWLFGGFGLVLWLTYVGGGMVILAQSSAPPMTALLQPGVAGLLYVVTLLHAPFHEFGHALTCAHYGGKVRRMGTGVIYGFILLVFADVTSSYLFAERWKRMLVMAAGLMGSLVYFASFAYLCLLLPPESELRQAMLLYALVIGAVTQIATNLNPLIKLDGYYLLAEWVDISDLRKKSFELAEAMIGRFIAGPAHPVPEYPPRERRILIGYAVASWVFVLCLVIFLVQWAYAKLVGQLRGYGLALLVLVVGFVYGPHVIAGLRRALRFLIVHRRAVLAPRQLLRVGLATGLWLALLLLIRLPETSDARFVVRPVELIQVRARTGGQVEQLLVKSGERVRVGQSLARLVDRELMLKQIRAAAEVARVRATLSRLESGARPEERRVAVSAALATRSRLAGASERARRLRELEETGLASGAEAEAARASMADQAGDLRIAHADSWLVQAGSRREDLDAARAAVRRAEEALDTVQRTIADLDIVSPIEGIVLDTPKELRLRTGSVLVAGDAVLTLGSDRFVAEVVPSWIGWSGGVGRADVKLFFHSGMAVTTRVASQRLQSEGVATLAFDTEIIDAPGLRQGLTGRAQIYGPPAPIIVEYLIHPVKRFFISELWASL